MYMYVFIIEADSVCEERDFTLEAGSDGVTDYETD